MIMRKFAQLCMDCDVIFANAFHELTACPRCGSSSFTPVAQFIKMDTDQMTMTERLCHIKKERENASHCKNTNSH